MAVFTESAVGGPMTTNSSPVTPAGSRAERRCSFDLLDIPLPTGLEEEWRFTPIDRLQPLFGLPVMPLIAQLPGAPEASDECSTQVGVKVGDGARFEVVERDDPRLGRAGAPGDRAAVVAWNAFTTAAVLTIPAGVDAGTTTITITGHGGGPCFGHTLIHAEAGSNAVVVLEHVGLAQRSATLEILVDEGTDLTVVSVQNWEAGTVHASSHRAVVAKNARLKHAVVTLGGDVVRITPDVTFTGEGGDAEMLGLYFADAGQHLEHRLFVDHAQPRCKSRVTYKGALQGASAHTVWVGDVLIQAHAEGTDTYELNRNLVLTKGARADSVPNLEIETGLIEGAGHASATGRFDDEQLFYLMARGIPEIEARRLVVRGFFAELIEQIGVPGLAERLMQAIEAELESTNTLVEVEG